MFFFLYLKRYDFSNVDIQLNTKVNIVNQSIFINDILLALLIQQLNELGVAHHSQHQNQQQQQQSSDHVYLLTKQESSNAGDFPSDDLFEQLQQQQQTATSLEQINLTPLAK